MTTIQPARTVFPSHVTRQLAWRRVALTVPFDVWIEREWIQFARRNGYRTRNGAAQAHFDRYMETLQA